MNRTLDQQQSPSRSHALAGGRREDPPSPLSFGGGAEGDKENSRPPYPLTSTVSRPGPSLFERAPIADTSGLLASPTPVRPSPIRMVAVESLLPPIDLSNIEENTEDAMLEDTQGGLGLSILPSPVPITQPLNLPAAAGRREEDQPMRSPSPPVRSHQQQQRPISPLQPRHRSPAQEIPRRHPSPVQALARQPSPKQELARQRSPLGREPSPAQPVARSPVQREKSPVQQRSRQLSPQPPARPTTPSAEAIARIAMQPSKIASPSPRSPIPVRKAASNSQLRSPIPSRPVLARTATFTAPAPIIPPPRPPSPSREAAALASPRAKAFFFDKVAMSPVKHHIATFAGPSSSPAKKMPVEPVAPAAKEATLQSAPTPFAAPAAAATATAPAAPTTTAAAASSTQLRKSTAAQLPPSPVSVFLHNSSHRASAAHFAGLPAPSRIGGGLREKSIGLGLGFSRSVAGENAFSRRQPSLLSQQAPAPLSSSVIGHKRRSDAVEDRTSAADEHPSRPAKTPRLGGEEPTHNLTQRLAAIKKSLGAGVVPLGTTTSATRMSLLSTATTGPAPVATLFQVEQPAQPAVEEGVNNALSPPASRASSLSRAASPIPLPGAFNPELSPPRLPEPPSPPAIMDPIRRVSSSAAVAAQLTPKLGSQTSPRAHPTARQPPADLFDRGAETPAPDSRLTRSMLAGTTSPLHSPPVASISETIKALREKPSRSQLPVKIASPLPAGPAPAPAPSQQDVAIAAEEEADEDETADTAVDEDMSDLGGDVSQLLDERLDETQAEAQTTLLTRPSISLHVKQSTEYFDVDEDAPMQVEEQPAGERPAEPAAASPTSKPPALPPKVSFSSRNHFLTNAGLMLQFSSSKAPSALPKPAATGANQPPSPLKTAGAALISHATSLLYKPFGGSLSKKASAAQLNEGSLSKKASAAQLNDGSLSKKPSVSQLNDGKVKSLALAAAAQKREQEEAKRKQAAKEERRLQAQQAQSKREEEERIRLEDERKAKKAAAEVKASKVSCLS